MRSCVREIESTGSTVAGLHKYNSNFVSNCGSTLTVSDCVLTGVQVPSSTETATASGGGVLVPKQV